MKKHLFTILIVIMSICLTSCNNLSQYKDGLNKKTSTPKSDSSSHSSDEDRFFSDVDDISSIIAGLESGNNSEGDISSPTLVNSNDKNGDTSSGNKPPNTEKTVINYKNMKAVWISYMDFGKFRGNSKEDFCKNVKMMFTKCKEIGLNTVITQVRAFGDAFYESQFFPWSRYVTGTAGKASDYDPLLVIVEEAHKLNLSVQAWINPYRIMTDTEIKQVNLKYKIRQWYTGSDNDYMINISGRWWLKPGNSEVKSLITDGANEIMKNYNVDGLHIDDYFYGASIESYEDTKQQAQKNTSELVQGLYKVVKSVDKNKIFGVSPAGGFVGDIPDSDVKNLSTDLLKWCKNPGYIDYVMPQIYWDYNHATAPFSEVFNKWDNFVSSEDVALYPGLAPYKIPQLMSQESIYKQIADINASKKAKGFALFRYENIVSMKFN